MDIKLIAARLRIARRASLEHWLKRSLVFACALLLFACASQKAAEKNQQADWILGESPDYPRTKYLVGVGEADTLALAKSRARAEVGKIFDLEIQSQMRDSTSFRRSESVDARPNASAASAGPQQSTLQEIERDIASKSKQSIQGLDVPLVWQDEQTQRYYALAALPRLRGASTLREQIDSLDDVTAGLLRRSQASASLIAKIRLSAEAIRAQQLREALNQKLQVLSIDGGGVQAPVSLAKLKSDRAALMARVTVRGVAEGMQVSPVKQALLDALANEGFTVTENGDYTLRARLESVTTEPTAQWIEQNATLSISLNGEGKRSLGGRSWDLRVRSTQEALLDQRLMEKVREVFNSELDQAVFDILDQQ